MKLIAENCAAMGQNGDNRLRGCSGRIGSMRDSYRTDSNVLRVCRQTIGCPINTSQPGSTDFWKGDTLNFCLKVFLVFLEKID